MTRIIGVGNVVVDLLATVTALPERGSDVIATGARLAVGGSAFTVLASAARQGATAVYAGMHGTGVFGSLARTALIAEGIRIVHAPVEDADTGYDVALTDADGERTFITVVGAEAGLTDEQLGEVHIEPTDFVAVSGYALIRDPGAHAIARWLAGLPETVLVLVDPGPLGDDIPAEVRSRVGRRATWWSCNEREALAAMGASQVTEAIAAFAERMPHAGILVRRGAAGCLVRVAGTSTLTVPAFTTSSIDTNGAGDTHVGAFLAELARGADAASAARYANAAAALAVTRRGPATAPTRLETESFLASR